MNSTTRTTMLLVIVVSLTLALGNFAAALDWKGFSWYISPLTSLAEVLPDGNLHTVHEFPSQAIYEASVNLPAGTVLTEVSFNDLGPDHDSYILIVEVANLSASLYVSSRPYESAYSYENGKSGFYTTFGVRTAGIHTFRLLKKSDSSIEIYLDGVLMYTDNYFKDNSLSPNLTMSTLGGYGLSGGPGADNIWTDFKALPEGGLYAPVKGRVILSNFDTANKWWTTAIGVEFIQSGNVAHRQTVLIDSDGDFTTSSVPPGTYDVAFKGSQFLRKVVTGVVIDGSGGATQLAGPVTLINGDLDGDNEITTADLSTALIPGLDTRGE